MEFFIKQNSTSPSLKMKLVKDGRTDYKEFHDNLKNANITFTMVDEKTGSRKISKASATIELKTDKPSGDTTSEYYIVYNWAAKDTKKVGTYIGEFKIVFPSSTGYGTLLAPIRDTLKINILESYTI